MLRLLRRRCRLQKRGFTITVAVDQMRLIRLETGVRLIDCVYSVEVVSRVVDVDI